MLTTDNNSLVISLSSLTSSPEEIVRRLDRWHLQAVARETLPEINRIAGCLRWRGKGMFVEVWQTLLNGHAFYRGLQTCAQVWTCPICAAKITERRRVELNQAIKVWKFWGNDVLMLTLTVPHHKRESVEEIIERVAKPLRLMKNRKTYKRIVRVMGIEGSIRSLETTYGANGWHVHVHLLLFVATDCRDGLTGLKVQFREMWESACVDAIGLIPSKEHGVSLGGGEKAGDYAAKWGLDFEMTKSHCKIGRDGNKTPWDLLRAIKDGLQGEDYVALFNEYAVGFRGRHQLEWSKGLRVLLGFGMEETDAEIAAKVDEKAILLGKLNVKQWNIICSFEKRGELLEAASSGGWLAVLDLIASILETS